MSKKRWSNPNDGCCHPSSEITLINDDDNDDDSGVGGAVTAVQTEACALVSTTKTTAG